MADGMESGLEPDAGAAILGAEMEQCVANLMVLGAKNVLIQVIYDDDEAKSNSLTHWKGQRFTTIGAVSCWLHDELAKP